MADREQQDRSQRQAGSEEQDANAYEDAWYRALKAKAEQRAAAEAAAKERTATGGS